MAIVLNLFKNIEVLFTLRRHKFNSTLKLGGDNIS